jgi:hypothetical protein
MTRIRLDYAHEYLDRHGKLRLYFRRPGFKRIALPGIPGSDEFMTAYQLALAGQSPRAQIGAARDVARHQALRRYGHKIIWYHGLSDPGPPVLGTILYYDQMTEKFSGLDQAQRFSRLYPVPNMDHCTGGATTDNFHLLAPLTAWVENNSAPGSIDATGTNFNATTYQVVGNFITDSFVNAPTNAPDRSAHIRSRRALPAPIQ